MEYPKDRGGFHAHKYVRLLMKVCAVADIGHHAAYLCVCIAHTEDAARYSGPVRFWNEQLMNVLGFKSPKQLTTARQKAIEAGWLHYERSSDKTVGKYWTLIPAQYEEISDSPIGENTKVFYSEFGKENGMENGMHSESGKENGIESGMESGMHCGMETGKHSIPIPEPSPIPIKNRLPEIVIPDKVNTPECHAAAKLWFRYLEDKGLGARSPEHSEPQLEAWWRQMARFGPGGMIEAINHSIANGWMTINPPRKQEAGGTQGKVDPLAHPDWIKALKVHQTTDGTPEGRKARAEQLTADEIEAGKLVKIRTRLGNLQSEYDRKLLATEYLGALQQQRTGTPF